MSRQSRQATAILIVLGLIGGVFASQGVSFAAQGPQLTAVLTSGPLPTDPADPAWSQAPSFDVPLIPQAAAPPTLTQISVPSVAVKSLHDGRSIAFRLEWADATRDAAAIRPDSFRDAAAIQLPAGETLTAICMGAPGELTNIWHWKADWQEDIDKGYQELSSAYPNFWKDYYPFATGQPPHSLPADFQSELARSYLPGWAAANPLSVPIRRTPVEEVQSKGFGTLTSKAVQSVSGRGVWADGRWQVVFVRPMRVQDQEAAVFTTGRDVPVAFAVWNGSNQEVGARKQLSTFISIAVLGPPTLLDRWYLLVASGIVVVAGLITAFWLARRWEARPNRGR